MLDPLAPSARLNALGPLGFRAVALFPRCTGTRLDDLAVEAVFEAAAGRGGLVQCGVLSVGVRKKLGLPSPGHSTCGWVIPSPSRRWRRARSWFLRRRLLSRGARPPTGAERSSRHIELEWLDQVPPRADARRRVSPGRHRPRRPDRLLFGTGFVVSRAAGTRRSTRPSAPRALHDWRQRCGRRRIFAPTSRGSFRMSMQSKAVAAAGCVAESFLSAAGCSPPAPAVAPAKFC